ATAVLIPILLVLVDFYRTGSFATPNRLARLATGFLDHAALFLLSVLFGIAADVAPNVARASAGFGDLSIQDRCVILFHAIAFYVGQAFWPAALAPLYSLPSHLVGRTEQFDIPPLYQGAVVGAVLLSLLLIAGWLLRRRCPAMLPLIVAYMCMMMPTHG